jgi:SMI1 / KNR4 family (SUKH-1)
LNAGASLGELESFEKANEVKLPADLRDYFLSVNGMPGGVTDNAMIRFWPLNEVISLPKGAPDYANKNYIENPSSFYLFADYSIWAHAYAIHLASSPSEANEILLVGGKNPIVLFRSFSELVDNYLKDEGLLFPS